MLLYWEKKKHHYIITNCVEFPEFCIYIYISCIIIVFITPIHLQLYFYYFHVYIAVAAVGLLVLRKGPGQNKMSTCTCNRVLNTIIICTIGITFLFPISFYLYLVRIGIKTGGIGGIAISLLPGALTAAMALFSRKLLKKYQKMKMSPEALVIIITRVTAVPSERKAVDIKSSHI